MLALARAGIEAGQKVTIIYSPVRASSAFLQQLESMPQVRAVELPMRREVGAHDGPAALKLRALLRALGPFDAVHSHSSKAGALARLGRMGASARHVYSPHGFVTMAPGASRTYGRIERGLARLADAIVAVSVQEKAHGIGIGIPASKLIVIPNGVDLAHAPPPKQPGTRLTLGFVGRLSEQKNPLLAVEAICRARDAGTDVSLTMIGDGELSAATKAAVEMHRLQDHVALLGLQRALDHFPSFDALLCTSRFEGMPLTFLEALGFGVPIISTRVGGTDELVLPGETGLLADDDPAALGAAIQAFAALPTAERGAMTARCRAHAGKFTSARMAADTFALYARLVAGGPVLSA
jgi:glycosyltransferase involved in cell wall biosynthesis